MAALPLGGLLTGVAVPMSSNSKSLSKWLIVFFFSLNTPSFAGAKCSKDPSEPPKQMSSSKDDLSFIKAQNQILLDGFGPTNRESSIFYPLLSYFEQEPILLRNVFSLGSVVKKDQIEDLYSKEPKRVSFSTLGIPRLKPFSQKVKGIRDLKLLFKKSKAYFLIRVNQMACGHLRFSFGVFVTDYREELMKPRLSDRFGVDAFTKYVYSIDRGAFQINHLEYKTNIDASVFRSHFNDLDYITSIPVAADDQATRAQALEEFKKRLDLIIHVKDELLGRNLITWAKGGRSSGGLRNTRFLKPDLEKDDLDEEDKLFNELLHFARLPLDEKGMSKAPKSFEKEIPLIFNLADCAGLN